MKKITITESRLETVKKERNITNVIHDLPVWLFRDKVSSNENDCPVCKCKIRKEVSHGNYIESCSAIQLDNVKVVPIHTDCYHQL
jgi:hypothetical protein